MAAWISPDRRHTFFDLIALSQQLSHYKQRKSLPVPVIGTGRGFGHRVGNQSVAEEFFSKVLKISRIFRFSGYCIVKNATLSTGC